MATVIEIRETQTGKYQLVRNGETSRASVMGRDVFLTRQEAERELGAMRSRVALAEATVAKQVAYMGPFIQHRMIFGLVLNQKTKYPICRRLILKY